jgi:chemosensory pili system protein ChpA (sensor histidine kinase/response regulator)
MTPTEAVETVESFVRLKASKVDALLQEIGVWGNGQTALKAQNAAMKQLVRDFEEGVERMQRLLKEVEISAESQISARKAELQHTGKGFDPLEMDRFTRLQEATKIMAEGVDDLSALQSQFFYLSKQNDDVLAQQGRGVKSAQEVVSEARLVPFDSLELKLQRMVAIAAKEMNKSVRLEVRGGDVKVDRAVLEKLSAPLEHILRNAVAHGIETVEDRVKAGKDAMGKITIEASPREHTFVLSCQDDGAGINTEKVRKKAIEKGWLSATAAINEQEAHAFLFRTGFSTADQISAIAGRGVGMDVVKTEVEQLGGQIELSSIQGVGAEFRLEVPLTIATTQALIVKEGAEEWALPSQHVKEVMTLREKEMRDAYAVGQYGGVPVVSLTQLLTPESVAPHVEAYNTLIHFSFGERQLYVQVERMLAIEDVVIRPLSKPLSLVQGFGGTAYLGEGRIGLLLQPFALLGKKEKNAGRIMKTTDRTKKEERRITAMVVDDSLTVRKVTGDLLKRNGFAVLLAKDGLDAIEQLQTETPDILLVDLEMPRMNGFELIEHVRNTVKFKDVPIVMITSRTAEKHQEVARGLGVNAYLGKPYQEKELLGYMQTLIKKE